MPSRTANRALFPGEEAPDFELLDQNGRIHSLRAYRGHWLILIFYPKDFSPACTRLVADISEHMRDFNQRDAKVLGINMDDQHKHAEFTGKNQLNFSLLSDEDGSVCHAFHSLWHFGPWFFVRRKTFIINPAGMVVRIHQRASARGHAGQLLHDLNLQQKLFLQKTG